jgi:hypothetical protein
MSVRGGIFFEATLDLYAASESAVDGNMLLISTLRDDEANAYRRNAVVVFES